MNETFASVLLFHTALKTVLLDTVGLTVDRTLGANDVILTDGAGTFLRLQKKTNGTVVSIGMELGTNADALEISTQDPELCFPFDTVGGGVFQGVTLWFSNVKRLDMTIMAGGERGSKRYSASVTLAPPNLAVVHQDHLNHATEPNFKENGGTYAQAGV